jgi:CHAD domain-containing protein
MPVKRISLLDRSTHEAVARLAGGYLDAAARGLARLENPEDPKGLHAFRVAIRRLRSLLRAYRPWLGKVAGRKVRRRLRDLTRDTNAGRDADVQLAWLSGERGELERDERPGFNWLHRRLADRRRRAYRSAAAQLGRDFANVVQLMANRLRDAKSSEPDSFRSVFLELLDPCVAEFRQRLAAISGADDEENAHRIRIQVKRLRYLVEPLRSESAEARDVVRPLKRLQNLLGELHDMHVLEDELAAAVEEAATEKARQLHELAVGREEKALARARRRDERLGLLALAARARERRDALYAELELNWLTGRGPALKQELGALAERVNASTPSAVIAG